MILVDVECHMIPVKLLGRCDGVKSTEKCIVNEVLRDENERQRFGLLLQRCVSLGVRTAPVGSKRNRVGLLVLQSTQLAA